MADAAPQQQQQPAKPGSACLACRSRKLKCSRESEGCENCIKADLPCVYPTPEVGVKRKRGPYKKDKPPRERHLEDLVRYLQPQRASDNSSAPSSSTHVHTTAASPPTKLSESASPFSNYSSPAAPSPQNLVKDALRALTTTDAMRREATKADRPVESSPRRIFSGAVHRPDSPNHPPARRILEYWHIYLLRVDPLLKLFHAPTFAKKLFAVVDNPAAAPNSTQALLYSIYFASVCSCGSQETVQCWGKSQIELKRRHAQALEASLTDTYSVPALELIQALVLYLICLQRQDDDTSYRSLHNLAVRMAQLNGIDQDKHQTHSPFEIQMRRRLWWHICGLESRSAEEGSSRTISIMHLSKVPFPDNLNDSDLDPQSSVPPKSRSGSTQISFALLRWELSAFCHEMWRIRTDWLRSPDDQTRDIALQHAQEEFFYRRLATFQSRYLDYLDDSRPFDWLCKTFALGVLAKAKNFIQYPPDRCPTRAPSSRDERTRLLKFAVDIISFTSEMASSEHTREWAWYFRNYMQWRCVAIVVAELCQSADDAFCNNAWAVLNPILADWDRIYKFNRGKPSWDHVHAFIERARSNRRHRSPLSTSTALPSTPSAYSATAQLERELGTWAKVAAEQTRAYPPDMSSSSKQMHLDTVMNLLPADGKEALGPPPMRRQSLAGGPPPGNLEAEPSAPPLDFENMFSAFDESGNINFQAFDEVFGDVDWGSFGGLGSDFNVGFT